MSRKRNIKKEKQAMRSTTIVLIAAFVAGAYPVYAQKPASGGAVIASEPGKAAAVAAVEITAAVTAIDKATRTISLKGPQGRTVDIVAGDKVRNFDQIKVGDSVVVQYMEALTLELKKAQGAPRSGETSAMVRAKPGERPAGAVGREVVVTTDVVGVDPVKSIISLKGPKGNVVDLKVRNPDHFKVVKVGDQVEAVYTEAVAVEVRPAAKSESKK
jgi:hypothetical protein